MSKQIRPKHIFIRIIEVFKQKKIEIPNYYPLADRIIHALNYFETELVKTVKKLLPLQQEQLDRLISKTNTKNAKRSALAELKK